MKKIISILFLFLLLSFCFKNAMTEEVVIPKDSIRFRVIPNSDSKEDQEIKNIVKQNLTADFSSILKNSNSLNTTRKNIQATLPLFEDTIEKTLQEMNALEDYNLHYGLNYFPEKKYKGITYEEGYYESLVVTLGEGKGSNWWCVLFPPLCLLEGEETNQEEVEYKSFVQELIDQFF